jgi:hypothetical protein
VPAVAPDVATGAEAVADGVVPVLAAPNKPGVGAAVAAGVDMAGAAPNRDFGGAAALVAAGDAAADDGATFPNRPAGLLAAAAPPKRLPAAGAGVDVAAGVVRAGLAPNSEVAGAGAGAAG